MHQRMPHLSTLVVALLTREEGEGSDWVLWSLGLVILGGIVAALGGSYISPEWREFVGRPLP